MGTRARPLRERFFEMVAVAGPDECWLWTGPVRKFYGAISEGGGHGRTLRSNRVAWELEHGQPIPEGLIVRHTCDVPLCCNPKHLVLGTHADNSRDCVERGRHVRGTAHPRSRLEERNVHEIRALLADGWTQREVAALFGVSQKLIFGIKKGTHWAHVPMKGSAGSPPVRRVKERTK